MITVLLVDDQPAVRRGLRMRLSLEPDLTVVGEAEDGEVALAQVAAMRPRVVLMDVEMPRMDGITATAALRALAPETLVVILTIHDDRMTRARAAAAGASAFVEKQAVDPTLVSVIRQAAGIMDPPTA